MARKKLSYVKKVLVFSVLIVTLQLVVMWRLKASQQNVVSLKDYMNSLQGESGEPLTSDRIFTKIQIALSDYRIKNKKYPDSLDLLVPEYFDEVPIDPDTSNPFAYQIYNDTFRLGAKAGAAPAATDTGTGETIQTNTEVAEGSPEEEQLLIASLNQDYANKIYDPSTRRDPFSPYDFTPKQTSVVGQTPLESFGYGQLRLAAVLLGFEQPKAILETPTGRGYTITIGDKVGTNGGEVRKIEQNKVTILESVIDFTGEKKSRIIELKIETKKVD